MIRCCLAIPAVVFGLAASASAVEPISRVYLEAHCRSCHQGEAAKGGFNIDALAEGPDSLRESQRWVRIHDRVQAGEMPPRSRPRPPQPQTIEFLKAVADGLTTAQQAYDKRHGRSPMRRLTRSEYENTLRDLLDLPALEVKELLPEDGRLHGFDKSAPALDISPIQMAKYLEAADKALDEATAKWAVPPELHRERMYAHQQYDFGVVIPNGDGVMLKDFKYDDSRFPLPKDKYAGGKYAGLGELERSGVWLERPGTAGLFRCLGESFPGRFNHFSPVHAGRYRITFSVWSFWWNKGEVQPSPRTQAAGIYYGGTLLGFFDAPSLKPTVHQIDVTLHPGEFLKFDAASLWEVHPYHHKDKAAGFVGPGVAIDFLAVEGPIHETWPPSSHKRLFGNLPLVPFHEVAPGLPKPPRELPRQLTFDGRNGPGRLVPAMVLPTNQAGAAEERLAIFLPRAFRRPVTPTEIARYVGIVVERLAAGTDFESALKRAYKAALCSPDFLFLREPLGPLDDYALAARLSYFLWNSMPDDRLMLLAEQGRLRAPEVLQVEIERMLRDVKSDRFIMDFLNQWLDLRDIDATTPDKTLYPEYTPYLRDAIRREPFEFFRQLLKENRSANEILQARFAMLNQRLAEHYAIAGVEGTKFRFVPLPADSPRGGLLTQAAILKVTSNGTTTSPVKRGAWVLRKLLDDPPQPPPPDIAAVEPDVRGTTTIREQLAKHRDNASCSTCHAKMDPPGFALESFDPIGGWRTRYRAVQGKDRPAYEALFASHLDPVGKFPGDIYPVSFTDGLPVDASGEIMNGDTFRNITDFRTILLRDPKRMPRVLVKQLATYATGAPIRFADRSRVEAILDRAGGNHGISNLIRELILDPLFLSK